MQIDGCIWRVLLFLVVSFCHPAFGDDGVWAYGRAQEGEAGFVISKADSQVLVGDLAHEAKFCDGRKFYCVESDIFSFRVPSRGGQWHSWRDARYEYRSLGTETVRVNEIRTLVTVVQLVGEHDGLHVRFLYSKTRGLVGVEFREKGKKKTALLRGICGFPFLGNRSDGCRFPKK